MNIGAISYATQSGLGILAKSFYDHGIVNRILLIRHPHYQNHPEWYPSENRFTVETHRDFLHGLDVLFLLENAFDWNIVRAARRQGIRIAMMPMYEWTPMPLPVPADVYLCPSMLDLQYYKDLPSLFVPVPVDVPWKQRTVAKQFIHNAGHGGTNYRNGTPELLEAMRYVQSPIHLTVRGQPDERQILRLFDKYRGNRDKRITFVLDNVPADKLYDGDVFVFPEKFNGLSLPLQEAYASGMLVMASKRFPMTEWLPAEPLIPITGVEKTKIAVTVDRAVLDPRIIARTIDEWYERDITAYSQRGRAWAESMSWDALKPLYLQSLEKSP
ncbi:MAG: hypothetical protein WC485_00065 [Opitutaceae bacterium]